MTKPSAPIAVTPYEFEWPVDQLGYEIRSEPEGGTLLSGALPTEPGLVNKLCGKGGPPRYYRPMERPGLWRRLADVDTLDGALAFAGEFGLLDLGAREQERVDAILWTAKVLR